MDGMGRAWRWLEERPKMVWAVAGVLSFSAYSIAYATDRDSHGRTVFGQIPIYFAVAVSMSGHIRRFEARRKELESGSGP